LLIEPLNRYETNLLNTLAQGAELVDALSSRGTVQLLADLFHMNIEEVDAASALRAAGDRVGHVHFVDSNRRPAGSGHLDFAPVARALQAMHYDGYASAEALPWPDSRGASERTLRMFRRCFGARP
jgi:sugar phosphate isomerase/epimerase